MTDSRLPLAVAIAAVLTAAPSMGAAQRTGAPPARTAGGGDAAATVNARALVRAAPGGRRLALASQGARLETRSTRAGATQVVLDGYVHKSLLAGKRDSFPASIAAPSGAYLRATPASRGAVIARLDHWMGVHRLGTEGDWVHVQRVGWIANELLDRAQVAERDAPPRSPAAQTEVARGPQDVAGPTDSSGGAVEDPPAELPAATLTPSASTALASSPGGKALGTLSPGAGVVPLARERGWVRVRVEGWVREADLRLADSTMVSSLSAADLRADTAGTRGRVIRWQVEVLAFQRADPLRHDLAPDEPYLLARGPGDERAILYLALPQSLVEDAQRLPALTTVIVTARVRTGSSNPSGVPILDVMSLARR
ncbi:MAG TPA: hypothetical protein VFK13_01990 [Gemmatimonadaceae bacterium]|nr:hypothetical protein [Gemmatimonadaceae bacterium]